MVVEALESHEQPMVEVSVIKYDDQCHFPQSVVRRSQRIRTAPCWRKQCFGCNEEKRSRKAGPRAEASRNVCEHGSPMKRGRPYWRPIGWNENCWKNDVWKRVRPSMTDAAVMYVITCFSIVGFTTKKWFGIRILRTTYLWKSNDILCQKRRCARIASEVSGVTFLSERGFSRSNRPLWLLTRHVFLRRRTALAFI